MALVNEAALSRLVLLDGEPKNAESMFLGWMLRYLGKKGRWDAAVTFADPSQGHVGTIYRASNWVDLGETSPEARWVDAEGRQVSKKKGPRSLTREQMRELGWRIDGVYRKRRFAFRFKRN